MSGELHHLSNPRWSAGRVVATVSACVLLMPFLIVALLPMLIMFVTIAVVAIPVIAPVMLSGKLAAHWERRQRTSPVEATTRLKRAPAVLR
jgi:hypothetical protein